MVPVSEQIAMHDVIIWAKDPRSDITEEAFKKATSKLTRPYSVVPIRVDAPESAYTNSVTGRKIPGILRLTNSRPMGGRIALVGQGPLAANFITKVLANAKDRDAIDAVILDDGADGIRSIDPWAIYASISVPAWHMLAINSSNSEGQNDIVKSIYDTTEKNTWSVKPAVPKNAPRGVGISNIGNFWALTGKNLQESVINLLVPRWEQVPCGKTSSPVIVYSLDGCPPCAMTKAYLKQKGVPFLVKDYDDPKVEQEMIQNGIPRGSTPVIVVGKTIIKGFSKSQINAAITNGCIGPLPPTQQDHDDDTWLDPRWKQTLAKSATDPMAFAIAGIAIGTIATWAYLKDK